MRKVALAVGLFTLAWAAPAGAVEQFTPTNVTPADGASYVQQAATAIAWSMTWNVPPQPPGYSSDAFAYVRVSSTRDVGTDGLTLSNTHQLDYFALNQSQTNPGYWQGMSGEGPNFWTDTPGTYYWQVEASYLDYNSPGATPHNLDSPIYTIVIAPTPPPPALGTTNTSPTKTKPTPHHRKRHHKKKKKKRHAPRPVPSRFCADVNASDGIHSTVGLFETRDSCGHARAVARDFMNDPSCAINFTSTPYDCLVFANRDEYHCTGDIVTVRESSITCDWVRKDGSDDTGRGFLFDVVD